VDVENGLVLSMDRFLGGPGLAHVALPAGSISVGLHDPHRRIGVF
jgi:hypothetical protein